MRIAILSRNPGLFSTSRIADAATKRDHDVIIVDPLQCYMNITSSRPSIHYRGESLTNVDAVIPRIGASITFFGTAVVRQFEMMGVYSVNDSAAIALSRDKLSSMQLLASRGIGLPVTGFAHSTKYTTDLIEMVGGAPLVVKLVEGTQGIGVVLAETDGAAGSVIEAFRGMDANILVQEFVHEAKGSDIRCFVVGDRVVASIKRTGREGEFRANLHRGGTAEKVRITPEERSIVLRSAQVMGLNVAGVDLLRTKNGPVVIEVNSSPGLEGAERASGVDIAASIITYVERAARPRD